MKEPPRDLTLKLGLVAALAATAAAPPVVSSHGSWVGGPATQKEEFNDIVLRKGYKRALEERPDLAPVGVRSPPDLKPGKHHEAKKRRAAARASP